MSDNFIDQTPQDDWSLEQLGEFVRQANRRRTIDAWRIGRALSLAKAKTLHGTWQAWLTEYGPDMSASTIHRLMRLSKAFAEEEAAGLRLSEAYRLAYGGREKVSPAAKLPAVQPAAKVEACHDQASVAGSGADEADEPAIQPPAGDSTPDPVQLRHAANEPPPVIYDDGEDELSEQEVLSELLDKSLPFLLGKVAETLDDLMAHDAGLRLVCWREQRRGPLLQQVTALRGRLDDLLTWAAEMPA